MSDPEPDPDDDVDTDLPGDFPADPHDDEASVLGTEQPVHAPVMVAEVCRYLDPQPGDTIVDGTLGLGGHALALCPRIGPQGRYIGLDRDPQALTLAADRLDHELPAERPILHLLETCYSALPAALDSLGIGTVQRILLDIGVSSLQLDRPERGFSFRHGGPLDMRMGRSGPTAAEWLATHSEEEIANAIYQYGEERHSRRIAKLIATTLGQRPITTTDDLAALVKEAMPRPGRRQKYAPPRIHPATRVFQALRIVVNDELGELERGLPAAFGRLAPGGRLVVLNFHSLEDRLVKWQFRRWAEAGQGRLVERKVVTPSDDECAQNPRARSTKLRVIEKCDPASGGDPAGRLSQGPQDSRDSRDSRDPQGPQDSFEDRRQEQLRKERRRKDRR